MKNLRLHYVLFGLALLPFLFISWSLFLKNPLPWPDEAIFHSVTKNVITHGALTTGIHGALAPFLENTPYAYPPLYFWLLGGWFRLMGDSLESMRAFSFMLSIIALGIVYALGYTYTRNKYIAAFGVIYLSLDFHFSRGSRLGRMDMLTALCILASLLVYAINHARHQQRQTYVVLGIFPALAFLSHPAGLLALGILSTSIWFEKTSLKNKFTHLSHILLPTVVAGAGWMLSFWGSYESLYEQLSYQMIRKQETISTLLTILQENGFLNPNSFLYGGIAVLVSMLILHIYRYKNIMVVPIAIGWILAVLFELQTKELWYLVYISTFSTLVLQLALWETYRKKNTMQYMGIILFILITLWTSVRQWTTSIRTEKQKNYYQFGAQLKQYIPDHSRVCIFSLPDPYFALQDYNIKLYEYLYTSSGLIDRNNFMRSCDYAIYNVNLDRYVYEYIGRNVETTTPVHTPGNYYSLVVKFKPNTLRQ